MKSCNMTTQVCVWGETCILFENVSLHGRKKNFLTNQMNLFRGYEYVSVVIHCNLVLVKFFLNQIFVRL